MNDVVESFETRSRRHRPISNNPNRPRFLVQVRRALSNSQRDRKTRARVTSAQRIVLALRRLPKPGQTTC